MFTLSQITTAQEKTRTGSDFPQYAKDLRSLGITRFVTWVRDSHTDYSASDGYSLSSPAMYTEKTISGNVQPAKFRDYLLAHQQGQSDYSTFCDHCAETGVEKWVVDLHEMTCTYFDQAGNEVLTEEIPG